MATIDINANLIPTERGDREGDIKTQGGDIQMSNSSVEEVSIERFPIGLTGPENRKKNWITGVTKLTTFSSPSLAELCDAIVAFPLLLVPRIWCSHFHLPPQQPAAPPLPPLTTRYCIVCWVRLTHWMSRSSQWGERERDATK